MPQPVSIGEGAPLFVYDGATLQKQLTPTVFKAVELNSTTATVIWAPAAGKKFRLQKYYLQITGGASSSTPAILIVTLRDGATTDIPGLIHNIYIPNSSGYLGDYSTGIIDLGRGYLSSTINNGLYIKLSMTFNTPGIAFVICNIYGVEE